MEVAVISGRIAQEPGLPEFMREFAGKRVVVYLETLSRSDSPKTVGIIAVDAVVNLEGELDLRLMTCMAVEFLEVSLDLGRQLKVRPEFVN